ncbi:MAG: hypothetical protein U9Q37_06095 [Euryarchaeota archaeon]|nr:hypothetical protein [Euryarchaeota archaeon]
MIVRPASGLSMRRVPETASLGDRAVYRYDAADSRRESFVSKSPDEIRMIKRQIIPSGDILYRFQQNYATWV